jgi:hypothetical protein
MLRRVITWPRLVTAAGILAIAVTVLALTVPRSAHAAVGVGAGGAPPVPPPTSRWWATSRSLTAA